ncbi:hypothetical protein ACJJTC_006650 [Scirpophaga incertulas]
MSQQKIKFGCCEQLTTSLSFVNCQICKLKYHLHCVNIQKQLKDLSEDFKTKFACPGCRSKFPKLDNTNTPIRSGAQPIIDPEEPATSNVNCRRGNLCIREFEQKTKELVENFNQISEAIKVFEQQQENLRTDLKSNSERINVLEAENISLKDTVIDLQSRIDRIEQHSRASNLEIQNVPEHKSENIYAIVKQIAAVTSYKLEETDLQLCTRTVKMNNKSERPRSIVVKFTSQRTRDNFLAATLQFNRKNKATAEKLNTSLLGIGGDRKPVFVVEHLSPVQKALHAAARFKARELNYKFVWIRGGTIFMRKTESSEYKLIKNTQDLSNLI